MAENPDVQRVERARQIIRNNIDRLERSATRLDDARERLVESAARLQRNHDLIAGAINDDTPAV